MTIEARALTSENRECGWQDVGTFACTPGEKVRAGCAAACKIGMCTGDPMLRICDASTGDNCSFPDKVASGTQGCGTSCPVTEVFTCPMSGQLRAFAAPTQPGAPFTCDVEVKPLAFPGTGIDTDLAL
jgi:hypothetical protein